MTSLPPGTGLLLGLRVGGRSPELEPGERPLAARLPDLEVEPPRPARVVHLDPYFVPAGGEFARRLVLAGRGRPRHGPVGDQFAIHPHLDPVVAPETALSGPGPVRLDPADRVADSRVLNPEQ